MHLTYPFTATDGKLHAHTWFCQRHEIRHILHEDATLELKFRLAALVDERFRGELVLRLAEIDIFAAEEDGLEEVYVVLRLRSLAHDTWGRFGKRVC